MDTKELYNKIIDGDAYEAEKVFNNLAMLKAQDRIDDTFDVVVNELNGVKINEAKKKYKVRLADDTVGEYECMNDKFIGKKITVKLHDENGNPIEKTGKAEEILDIDESVINEKDLELEVIDYVTTILKNSKKKLNFDEVADKVIAKYGRNAITWRNVIKLGFHNNRQKFN